MKLVRVGVALLATCVFGASVSHAALNAYLKLKGTKTTKFNPSVPSDQIMVIAVSHEIVSPRDPASGLPTGKRMHKPFVIHKEWDSSTPQLLTALAKNEAIKEIEFTFFESAGSGKVKLVRKATLQNAKIKSIRKLPTANGKPPMEEISFTYQKITWTDLNQVVGVDDWKQLGG